MRRIVALLFLAANAALAAERPNILWITLEDLSPELGCYGDPYAITPHIDALAAESVMYTRAFSNGGACAPARSALITGMYPPSIGTHHMRSEGRPPGYVRAFTEYLRDAGYYCSNHSKTDYNWRQPESAWDVISPDWREEGWRRRGGKPFFTVINLMETHSSQVYHPWTQWRERREALPPELRHDPAKAAVPAYYPDTPETREILRRYADNVAYTDRIVGGILAQLEEDGLKEDTIVFFFADHGTGLPRSKSFQFDSSTRVPLLIRFPGKFAELAPARPGGRVERLTAFVDFAPTVLTLAGIEPPAHFQGRTFLGSGAGLPPQFLRLPRPDGRALRVHPLRPRWAIPLHPQLLSAFAVVSRADAALRQHKPAARGLARARQSRPVDRTGGRLHGAQQAPRGGLRFARRSAGDQQPRERPALPRSACKVPAGAPRLDPRDARPGLSPRGRDVAAVRRPCRGGSPQRPNGLPARTHPRNRQPRGNGRSRRPRAGGTPRRRGPHGPLLGR